MRGLRLAGCVLAGATVIALTLPAQAQRDRWVTDIIKMSEDKSPEDGFCKRVPWEVAGPRAQTEFLERARVGSAEAARFTSGACSFTSVTDTYRGGTGKCVKYSWWACGPAKTCDLGDTNWCKVNGTWKAQD